MYVRGYAGDSNQHNGYMYTESMAIGTVHAPHPPILPPPDLGPGEPGVYAGAAVSRRRQCLLTGSHKGTHHLWHLREQDMRESSNI